VRRSGVREIKLSVPHVLSDAEELGVCAVCSSDDGADEGNAIIMCDSCGIAVHQACPKYLLTVSLRAYVLIMIGPEIGTDPEPALQSFYGITVISADCDK
jgi:hypothetical protein